MDRKNHLPFSAHNSGLASSLHVIFFSDKEEKKERNSNHFSLYAEIDYTDLELLIRRNNNTITN